MYTHAQRTVPRPCHYSSLLSLPRSTSVAAAHLCSLKSGVLELSQNVYTTLEVVLGELQ